MQLRSGDGAVEAGGEDHQVATRGDGHRGDAPLGERGRVVGEEVAVERCRVAGGVAQFDPVGGLAVLVEQAFGIVGHELGDDRLAGQGDADAHFAGQAAVRVRRGQRVGRGAVRGHAGAGQPGDVRAVEVERRHVGDVPAQRDRRPRGDDPGGGGERVDERLVGHLDRDLRRAGAVRSHGGERVGGVGVRPGIQQQAAGATGVGHRGDIADARDRNAGRIAVHLPGESDRFALWDEGFIHAEAAHARVGNRQRQLGVTDIASRGDTWVDGGVEQRARVS